MHCDYIQSKLPLLWLIHFFQRSHPPTFVVPFFLFFFLRLPEGSSKISWNTLVSNLHRQRWPWTAGCLGVWDELWRTPYLAQSFNSSSTCKRCGFQSIPQKFLWNCFQLQMFDSAYPFKSLTLSLLKCNALKLRPYCLRPSLTDFCVLWWPSMPFFAYTRNLLLIINCK